MYSLLRCQLGGRYQFQQLQANSLGRGLGSLLAGLLGGSVGCTVSVGPRRQLQRVPDASRVMVIHAERIADRPPSRRDTRQRCTKEGKEDATHSSWLYMQTRTIKQDEEKHDQLMPCTSCNTSHQDLTRCCILHCRLVFTRPSAHRLRNQLLRHLEGDACTYEAWLLSWT